MTPAFLTRIATLVTTGQPKAYAGSDMAKADFDSLITLMGKLSAPTTSVAADAVAPNLRNCEFSQTGTSAAQLDERGAFEAWYETHKHEALAYPWTESACWFAWQARAASQAGAWENVRSVRDTFKCDIEQGYVTKDKQFAVELLDVALAAAPHATMTDDEQTGGPNV